MEERKSGIILQLSIIIINYKTPQLTHRCIESIYNSINDIDYEIIVVDNASKDNSKDYVLKDFPNVVWIQNNYNAGFGRANNLGVQDARGKFVLLLNSDMLLLKGEKIEKCLKQFEFDKNIGVLGCKLLNEDGSFQKSTYYDVGTVRRELRNNILWYKLMKPKPKLLDAVMGSFMLFRKVDFELLNGFDKDFFMYAEELELCMRFQRDLGKKVVYNEEYTAIHKHGGSSEASDWSIKQNMLSNALLHFKLNGWIGYLKYHATFHFNMIINFILFFTLDVKSKKSYQNQYKAYLSSYFHYFVIPFFYSFKKERNFLKYN